MPELTRRYVVMTMAAEAPFDPADPEEAFVLKPWKDPAALRALMVYRDNCYPELASDLDAWIATIESGPTLRGDVGRRNEPHVKARRHEAGEPAAPRPARRRATAPKKRRPAAKRGSATRATAKRAVPRAKKRRR
jgi:hypothetical protein